ncbi:right-handed parallel beta-helix repeat-containing protein [Lysobacter korlensis]|uniref:Right-handed parallel beta-helix repeat-containing protein n=1 Tax=Lysobacter korlensis TaxID=553636 RepID=A0ABV6RRP6_9GAMM
MPILHRTSLLSLLLVPLGLVASGVAQAATTYYVRTDGGTATQCNGRSDAAYPGSGTGRSCAWKHPFYALPPKGPARIAGGDTLIIGGGSYMMGQGAPGAVNCNAASCFMTKIPNGPSSTSKTRILGKSGTTPKLWATERATRMINLEGSSNVEIGNLEITDRSDCVYDHSVSSARCKTSSAPYGQWGRVGIYARASSNVYLHDLNIHGMAHMGINAGGLSNWTLERVRINKNGKAGWDANVGDSISNNSGTIVLRDVEIAWNGCGERWQTGAIWACWAQSRGGYGDGLGTYYTGGKWLIEDSFIHHNTSDGLDLRYMDGKEDTTVTIRRVHAVGNAGNQVKVRGNALIENSVLVGNCTYWTGKHYMLSGDNCRASGNTLQFVLTPSDDVTVRHNTITGQGGVLVSAHEGDSATRIRMQNNVLVGFPRWDGGGQTSAFYTANKSVGVSWGGNLMWKVRNGFCPSGSTCGKSPMLKNMTLSSFDATPLSGSPVRDKVLKLDAVPRDFLLQPRPSGLKSDIGAYEMQ